MSPRPRSGVVLSAPAPPTTPAGVPTRTAPPARKGLGGLTSLGPRGYLYLLVLLEVAAIAGLRHLFRDHHGG